MRNLVVAQTAKRLKKFEANLKGASRRRAAGRGDADGIHDLRVSIRRLRQGFRVFEAWFDCEQLLQTHRRLRKLMKRCAAVRNYDVARDVLRAAGWEDPRVYKNLGEQRRAARRELAEALRKWNRGNRLAKWRGKLRPVPQSGGAALHNKAEHARRILPAMLSDLIRAGRNAARIGASHEQMHQFRLKTKRMRYTLELFESVYGIKTKRLMNWLKGLQEKLGAINDCAVTLEMVRSDRGASAAVRKLAHQREAEFRTYWKRTLAAPAPTQWKAVLAAADGKR